MRQIIGQILEGNFDYENGSLDFSCSKLEISLKKGTVYEGIFSIYSRPGLLTRGTVTSSDLRMECLTPEFTGTSEDIAFRFHGEHLDEGEAVNGEFFVISSQGEYYLPFVVTVEKTVLHSSVGIIKNLFHFVNLAKNSWKEAVNLFYDPEFVRVFKGGDRQFYGSYLGLSVYRGNEQNMEEFLIGIDKKQRIEYYTQEESVALDNPFGVAEEILTVVRSGWGYTFLQVRCEGDFLFTEKGIITEDDFLGNICRLPVYIDSDMLNQGKNFGRLSLYNPYLTITVPVLVKVGDGGGTLRNIHREEKSITVQLMEYYQAFRQKKIGTATWLKEARKLAERMVALNDKNVAVRLFQAQLLITEECPNEAKWLLDHALELLREERDSQSFLWAYYLYLTTLINNKETYISQVTEEVLYCYRKDQNCWRSAWLLLYISEEYSRNAVRKWHFIEKQITYGCRSPMMYIEALLLLNSNPTLLRKLGTFELQVLSYGAKEEMLSPEVQEQLLYLTGKFREYSRPLLRILIRCHEKQPDTRMLQEICTLLIRGGMTGPKYFLWYRRGVEAELRITKLYEYYMTSIDMEGEEEIPKIVLMYFSYQNNLDYEHSAFLYSYLMKRRFAYQELYAHYQERIGRFVLEQIQKEHMNRHLAYLYWELLTPGMLGEQTVPALARLLFAHLIRPDKPGMSSIIVYQPGKLTPQVYPINGNTVWISLYGDEYTILLEDRDGNRYIRSVGFHMEQLVGSEDFISLVSPYVKDNLELDLYLSDPAKEPDVMPEENIKRYLRLMESPVIARAVKRRMGRFLLKYFYDHDEIIRLDSFLENIPGDAVYNKDRGEILRYLVLREKYDAAYNWLSRYGPYNADPKILMRLCDVKMRQSDQTADEVLIGTAIYVFRLGKYDGNLLMYLSRHFNGLTEELRNIWNACVSFDLNSYELCEKILVQMLFTASCVEEKMDIFYYYLKQGAKPDVEAAFLSQCAYDYFVREKLTERLIFDEIWQMYKRGEPMGKICRLGFLKYFAANPGEISRDYGPALKAFLQGMVTEGIYLNYFKVFKDYQDILQPLFDKTIIEYRAHPEAKARIHYVILRDGKKSGDYLAEDMKPVYGGICFKDFVLFFGEDLQYYITESRYGEEELTESGSVQVNDIPEPTQNHKFNLLNDIITAEGLEDYDTMDDLLEDYLYKEFLNRELFRLRIC